MYFDTIGNKNNPAIIMINGSFCTGKGLLSVAEKLSEHHYIILPTYDGHYEKGGEFTSRDDQVKKMMNYLKEQNITEIALIHGISMGAEIALNLTSKVLQDNKMTLEHAYFDGGPFFNFNKIIIVMMRQKFLSVIHQFKKDSTDQAVQQFLNSKIAKWMLKGDTAPYYDMVSDMHKAAKFMSDQSVRRESDACYTFDYPSIAKEQQKKLVFSWSDDEPAIKSRKKIMSYYPDAKFETVGKLGHCGFIVRKQDEYVSFIKNIIN